MKHRMIYQTAIVARIAVFGFIFLVGTGGCHYASAASSIRAPLRPNSQTTTLGLRHDDCNSFRDSIHNVRTFPTSRTRQCSQEPNSEEHFACKATGAIRCSDGATSSGVVVNLTNQESPAYLVTAAHTIFNRSSGAQKSGCYFYPNGDSSLRVPIVDARNGARTGHGRPFGSLDGDISIARLGSVERLVRGRWTQDSAPSVVRYSGALPLGDESTLADTPQAYRSVVQVGFDVTENKVMVSDNCRPTAHRPGRDHASLALFAKSSCSAPAGWSGGPIVAMTRTGGARVVCIQSQETDPRDRSIRNYDSDSTFNLCSPIDRQFARLASDFARGRGGSPSR